MVRVKSLTGLMLTRRRRDTSIVNNLCNCISASRLTVSPCRWHVKDFDLYTESQGK